MTDTELLDHFAGTALETLVEDHSPVAAAMAAYQYAETMMAERAKRLPVTVPKREPRRVWVNEYRDGLSDICHQSKGDVPPHSDRISCVEFVEVIR